MTTAVTVHLDDETVRYVDGLVRSGRARNREEAIACAARRQAHGAQIFAMDDPDYDDDLDRLAEWAADIELPVE